MFPLQMASNMTLKEMKNRVDFCLNRVDLKNVNQLFPSQLSGGMQKRVAIARALIRYEILRRTIYYWVMYL